MFDIHGIHFSFNTTKVVYVAEALGLEYRYHELDLRAKEHKAPAHLARSPFGKAPTLTHGDKTLFESGAICRYLASVSGSEMYPIADHHRRCEVDQWMDFYSVHLGRWLGALLFERVFRAKFGLGETNKDNEAEALKFANEQLAALDKHLEGRTYLVGDAVTIADVFAFAYMETTELSQLSLADYPNVIAWYQHGTKAEPIKRGKAAIAKANA